MASRIIFNIIRIIFKYGRLVLLCGVLAGLVRGYTIKARSAPILTYVQGKRITTMPLIIIIIIVKISPSNPPMLVNRVSPEVIAKTMQLRLMHIFNVAPENWHNTDVKR